MLWLLRLIEQCFPLVPSLGPAEVDNWVDPRFYYFVYDLSPRRAARWKAVLRLDRAAVSFWRKREAEIQAYLEQACLRDLLGEEAARPDCAV